jgi:aryl-alcohol dehydrogenase-like predicted oxidoreductase
LNAVVDNGITLIDTANDYGRSEEYIGRFLLHRRDEFVLATKCGCTVVRRDKSTDDTPHVWIQGELVPRLTREPGANANRLRRRDAAALTSSVEHPTAGIGQSSDHGAEWNRLAAATRLLIP